MYVLNLNNRKKGFIVILLLPLALQAGAGCKNNAQTAAKKPVKKEAAKSAHVMSVKTQKEALKDAREDLLIITRVKRNLKPLKKALGGRALNDFSAKIKTDLAAGKITVRKYDNIKLTVQSYTDGKVGVSLAFTDNSYYVDSKSNDPLESPRNKPVRLALSLEELDGRWKITDFLAPQASEMPQRQPYK